MGSRGELAEHEVGPAAGEMESVPDSVPGRGCRDREIAESVRPEPTDPLHRVEEEGALGLPGGWNVEVSPFAPGTGLRGRGDAVFRRSEHLDRPAAPERAAHLVDLRLDLFARQASGDEADAVLSTRDTLAGRSET
jgi:hypothetical protein